MSPCFITTKFACANQGRQKQVFSPCISLVFSLWEGSPFGAHQDERVDSTRGIFDATANMKTKLLHCSSSVGMRPHVDKQTEVKRRRRQIECEQRPERHPRTNIPRIIVGPHGKPTITNRIFGTCRLAQAHRVSRIASTPNHWDQKFSTV